MINILREMRGGKDYDAKWFERRRAKGVYANIIAKRFANAARRSGLNIRQREPLRTDLFRPVESPGGQLNLNL